MELKFVRQNVQGVYQAAAYQLQVLLCVMGEVQPHFPVLLSGQGQRPEENRRMSEKLPVCSREENKTQFHLMKLVRGNLYENCSDRGVSAGNE